jgi:DNA-binding transcriptional LysR family regulator
VQRWRGSKGLEHMNAMHVFAQVVEAGSFSEAARRLGFSKSAVSRQVTQLEGRLGAQLLQRTTRRIALTEAGRLFHDRCARILRDVEDAEREVTQAQRSPRGVLRVNAPLSLGRLALGPMLPAFLARHSELRVELALDDRRVDAVEGGFDVTIRIAEQLPDSSAISRRIAAARVVVCAAPSYLARHGYPRTPAELARHECLIYSNRERWLFRGASGDEWTDVSGRLRANDADTLREAVLAGLGLAQIPRFIVAADLARSALETVLEPFEASRSASIWALYSPTRHLSAKVRAFVDFLAERFASEWHQPSVPGDA